MKTATIEHLECRRLLASFDVSINPSVLHQEWTGFGGAPSAWRNGGAYNDPAYFNALASDAGLNAVRLPLWYALEERNDNADPDVMNWNGFNVAALAPTMKFAQEMQKRGADTFLASVWTPPWWMKATAAHPYGGPLRADMREEFAEYLAAYVISAKRDYGVDIDVISLQNEAQFIEPYESTIYTPQQLIATYKVVKQKFVDEGLTTRLMVPEELPLFNRWKWWDDAFRADQEFWNSDFALGVHFTDPTYYGQLKQSSLDSGQPVWLTEAPSKGSGSWDGALRLSEDISGMMNFANTSAFFEWMLDDPDPQYTIYSNGAKTNRWHSIKHYAHWVRPGARRMEMTTSAQDLDGNRQNDVFATSWHHAGNNAQTIVLTNFFSQSVTFNVTLTGSRTGTWNTWLSTSGNYFQPGSIAGSHNSFSVTLPGKSMMTLYDNPSDPVPQYNLTSARGNVNIVYANDIQLTHAVRRNALQGSEEWVRNLANSTNIHEEFVNGRDAIFAAAASPERGIIGAMNALIELGARVNNPDNEGITPLMVAASTPMMWYTTQSNDPTLPSKKLDTLLNAGANLHAKDLKGRTALHWAAQVPRWIYNDPFPHDSQVPQFLLQEGADKNKVDRFGKTPLMWAQQEGNYANASAINAWTQDGVAPEVLESGFEFNTRQAATITFDEAMSSFGAGQIGAWILDGSGNPATAVNMNVTTRALPGTNTQAELVPTSRLANGNYRVLLKSGQTVRDKAGNAIASGAVLGDFWFLNADANRDKRVDSRDYRIFRQNFGKSGVGFTGGDFDYDGRVTMKDFRILRENFRVSLVPTGPGGDPPLPGADPPTPPGQIALPGTTSDGGGGQVFMSQLRGQGNVFRSGGVISLIEDDSEQGVLVGKR